MTSSTINTSAAEISFKELKLRPGTLLQVRRTVGDVNGSIDEAQFVTAIAGKGIMISPCESNRELIVGEQYYVQGFTGQYDFTFSSCVIQNFKVPFSYALFVYPDAVSARLVRKAMRMKTNLPAAIRGANEKQVLPGSLIDLSVAGAMLSMQSSLGSPGDLLELSFSVEIDDNKLLLRLSAKIAHSSKIGDDHRIGLMFNDLAVNDKVALLCYVNSIEE